MHQKIWKDMVKLILLFSVLFYSTTLSAQPTSFIGVLLANDFSYIVNNPTSTDGDPKTNGAFAMLSTSAGTLYAIAIDGMVVFDSLPCTDNLFLTVSHINFKQLKTDVSVRVNTINKIPVILHDKSKREKPIPINGVTPEIIIKDGMLVYNSAAVKLFENDLEFKILKLIPGALITDDGISIPIAEVQKFSITEDALTN